MLSALPQKNKGSHAGPHLGKRGGNGRTGGIQTEHRHQHDVQHNVDGGSDQDEDQRPFGLAHAAQNAANGVVAKNKRVAQRRDDHVRFGLKQCFLRAVQQL